MSANPALKLLFVINPGSGTGNLAWKDIINDHFAGKKITIDYFELKKTSVIADIRQYVEHCKPGRVIAVGGDGTVTMVAKAIADAGIVLGLLPAGSANGMAKELNISNDPFAALSIIENGHIKSCDAIKINNEHICLHLSDIGLNAQLIKYFNEGKFRGKFGYARVIIKTLWRRRRMQVVIAEASNLVKRDVLMVVLANASKYGTGAVINPEGVLDDGLFEVVLVRKLALIELLKMLVRPGTFNPQNIEIFRARSVNIETQTKVHFQVDGEYIGKIDRVSAVIIPAYIKVILPGSV